MKFRSISPDSIPPQEMICGGIPIPRKLNYASMTIADPTIVVATTIIGPNVLGNMWRSIIRVLPAPAALAASTYGISLMLSAWDLIIRIPRLLKMTTMATIRLVNPGLNIAISVRANNRDGMNVIASTKR